MKLDADPSIIFGAYTTPEAYEELIKELKNKGLGFRELKFIDVTIPLNEKYDDTINFFKHFINNRYWYDRNPLLRDNGYMVNKILNQVYEKAQYKPIKFDRDQWQNDNRHKLLWTLLVPLFYQDSNTKDHLETDEEKANYEKLKNFKSEGYTPMITGIYNDDGTKSKGVIETK